jgi:hypothetical protein
MGGDPIKEGITATIESLMRPVNDIIEKIAGPAAEELGQTFRDRVRVFRVKQQVKLFEKVKKILECGRGMARVGGESSWLSLPLFSWFLRGFS